MNYGIVYFLYRLFNFFSNKEKLGEIRKKTDNLEPISKEKFNIWSKSMPESVRVYKTYEEYMKIANASPEEKARRIKEFNMWNEAFEHSLDELAKKDKRWRKGFFSKYS